VRVESYVKGRPRHMVKEKTMEEAPSFDADSTPFDINPELTRRKAKELYLLYGWSKQQLLTLGIPETTLNTWLYKPTVNSLSWHQEKEVFQNSILARMKENKAEELEETVSRGVSVLKRSLMALDLEGTPLTVNQMERLTNMLGKLDHIINLEKGKPTSISADVNLAQKDIDAIVEELEKLDPLLSYSGEKIN
jgi:hypothetical protein